MKHEDNTFSQDPSLKEKFGLMDDGSFFISNFTPIPDEREEVIETEETGYMPPIILPTRNTGFIFVTKICLSLFIYFFHEGGVPDSLEVSVNPLYPTPHDRVSNI
jgi:hypothetical protein